MMKWKKVAAVTTASAMTIQLAACGSEETYVEETSESYTTSDGTGENETYLEEPVSDDDGELTGLEESEYMDACADWEEQEDGSYVCDDEYSEYHGQHFFDGLMYATIGAMVASSYYQSKNKINGTKRKDDEGGSGGGYRGSSGTSPKTNGVTNGSSTGGQTNSSGTSTTTDQNKTGTNKPSNGTSTYSSGKSGFSSGGSSRGGSSSSQEAGE